MKIIDTSGSLLWRLRQRSEMSRATGQFTGNTALREKLSELHRATVTTRTPALEGYYKEGRSNLGLYENGFSEINDFAKAYTSGLQNARMTDEEIEQMIERMNLTPR
jgi:hypothetical protein